MSELMWDVTRLGSDGVALAGTPFIGEPEDLYWYLREQPLREGEMVLVWRRRPDYIALRFFGTIWPETPSVKEWLEARGQEVKL